MTEAQKQQVEMHKNFFEKSEAATENGYYLEAIFHEYAAIEGRLEIILGVLGLPCNKNLERAIRKDMKISHRVECFRKIFLANPELFAKSKINAEHFKNLKNWLNQRNIYIHGLYKNSDEYIKRTNEAQKLAMDGLVLARLIYNETNRLKRILHNHPEMIENANISCSTKNCKANMQ